MNIRIGLRTKMVLIFATIIVAVFAIAFWILNGLFIEQIKGESENSVVLSVKESAQKAKMMLTQQMAIIQNNKDFLEADFIRENNKNIDYYSKLLTKSILEKNGNYYSVWIDWELNHTDKSYNKKNGRTSYSYYRDNGDIVFDYMIQDTTNDDIQSDYYTMKKKNKGILFEPYYYSFQGVEDSVLMTSLALPLNDSENNYIGIFGIDITLDKFSEITSGLAPYKESQAFMMTESGSYITHYNKELIGQNFYDLFPEDDEKYGISKNMKTEKPFSVYRSDDKGEQFFVSFVPIKLDNIDGVWYIGVNVPVSVILSKGEAIYNKGMIIIGVVMLFLIFFVWMVANSIVRPLSRVTAILKKVAVGEINTKMKVQAKEYASDEIDDINQSVNILIDGLNNTSEFAISIGQGKLDTEYDLLSENDVLGQSLLEMRDSLKNAQDLEAIRKEEGRQQQWTSSGLANFGQILRENQNDMEEFSYKILSELLKYVDAHVGGFYLVEEKDGEQFIELKASVAYEQRKFINQQLGIHEGLIGQCILENDVIYLTDIPENYIRIVSGLGSESPDSLMLVPLKVNDVVFGVIEIAAFKLLADYEREFIEKVSQNIASTISSVRVNIKTKELLETSKQKSEELAAQEEEMRQNLEELQATQEESDRKTSEIENLLNSLSKSNFFVEYNPLGKIIEVNNQYANMFGLTRDQMIGMSFFDNDLVMKNKDLVWNNLKQGSVYKNQNKVCIGNNDFTLLETYTPIFNTDGKLLKVLKISNQLSDFVN